MISGNTHFAIGVHVMTALSLCEGEPRSSGALTETVVTSASFLRVVLGQLQDAGLIKTKAGRFGGSTLAHDADDISLLEIFRATAGDAAISVHDCSTTSCALGKQMPELLREVGERVDAAIAAELASISVADLASKALAGGLSAPGAKRSDASHFNN